MEIEQLIEVVKKNGLYGLLGGLVGPMAFIRYPGLVTIIINLILGFKIASNEKELYEIKKENEKLKEELKKSNLDNAIKQDIIKTLNRKIDELKDALAKEKRKVYENEEKIKIIQSQLDDLLEILKMAKAA